MNLVNFALGLFTAALLILCFPNFDIAFLAPVALVPLLVAVGREASVSRRFLIGYAAGVAFWAGTCYWIQDVLSVYGGMNTALSWLGFAIFALWKGLQMGIFAVLAGMALRRSWAVIAVPAIWVAIEWTHGPLAFGWLALGNAGIDMAALMRLAPYTGVYGLSFVFAAMAVVLAMVILARPREQLLWAVVLIGIAFLPAVPELQRGDKTAVLVQPNLSQSADWTPEWVAGAHRRLNELSDLAWKGLAPDLIVWPEVPAPMYYYDDERFRNMVNEVARRGKTYLILNVVPFTEEMSPLNGALLVSPAGDAVARYDKMNLVPFGEFVPWPFTFVRKISTEAGDFVPGEKLVMLPVRGRDIGVFVCYESAFPNHVRQFARDGAELLVNISNDGWYGKTAARDQHLKLARMRAAENRRWLLRATNDGITATIDPAGRVAPLMPSYMAGSARAGFSYLSERTVYSRFGDWFVALCALLGAAALVISYIPQYEKPVREEPALQKQK